ncbi:hypothetical protein SASPL_114148 [Salvia splendens]|uniref:DNA helicase n=1 Tax=Salvia splendens TaxID=180675 RepID=A0A8X8Y1A6_SALSN|nr:hypothetical protein SASPL_114148 [Salvia splendens]
MSKRPPDHYLCKEFPENSAPGQLPRTVDIIVEDDLVDSCKPGDRVAIVGIYKGLFLGKAKAVTVLIANNVSLLNKMSQNLQYSTPSIYGHSWIKKAVILLMLGGISVVESHHEYCSSSHIYHRRGSSGVGLTAAVTSDQETGERRLEAGAMVLADRGVVCIDEFDKMNDQDRVAIHEVMEQQTVTIAKAGIHASLNARCSVVAAANPIYGTYDRSLTPTKNIGLPDSLLSRFDLLFIVWIKWILGLIARFRTRARMHRYRSVADGGTRLDESSRNEVEDDPEAGSTVFVKYNRMLHGRKSDRSRKRDTLTINFLKKYIYYAKSKTQPELTDEASEHIATTYAELRNASSNTKTGGTLPITARTLETIIRLSTAHAKLMLRRQVLKSDAEAALQVLNFAIYHQELSDMEARENERLREMERDSAMDTEAVNNDGARRTGRKKSNNAGSTATTDDTEAMDVDPPPTNEVNLSSERLICPKIFSLQADWMHLALHWGVYRHAQHVEQMSIADIEGVVKHWCRRPLLCSRGHGSFGDNARQGQLDDRPGHERCLLHVKRYHLRHPIHQLSSEYRCPGTMMLY